MYVPTLRKLYNDEIVGKLKKFSITRISWRFPRFNVSINIGLGDAKNNSKGLESAFKELALISGQKPIVTKAKKISQILKLERGGPLVVK